MPKLKIDGIEIEVADGMSVIQACETAGVEIPRFCYHDKLPVPANCRMCLVEQVGAPKPVPSCAIKAAEGMEIKTNSELVHKARKGVMEFLLINHPLDCPICDQGGECDLQDQAVAYGFDRSRYQEEKRAVKDKDFGPLVKTTMTRCIHCTRCIRFGEQIGGCNDLGLLGRGEDTEVGTFVEKFVANELSGNLIDVCPVGALTSKPYAFKARPWEMRKTESIDVMDAVGSNIRVDTRSNAEVMRILPRLHEEVNEEWISDKTRFAYDGLKYQRLDRPYKRIDSKLVATSWDDAFGFIQSELSGLQGNEIAALAGDQADCEAITALKDLMTGLGSSNLECRTDGASYDVSNRAQYIMNSEIAGIDQADVILLIGAMPKREATMINARIRRAYVERKIAVGVIGEGGDYTYPYTHIGDGPKDLSNLIAGNGNFADVLKNAKNPLVIVGGSALARKDGAAIQQLSFQLATQFNVIRDDWNGYNVMQLAANRVGALDLGFVQAGKDLASIYAGCQNGTIKAVYVLDADNIDPTQLGDAFIIYQGHHGDVVAHHADVILPGAAYTEKNAIYVNTEGRVQQARQAMFPLGDAKEDWKIIRALAEKLLPDTVAQYLPYKTTGEIRNQMIAINPVFAQLDQIQPVQGWSAPAVKSTPRFDTDSFLSLVPNFYQSCAISRASPTMAKCVQAFLNPVIERIAAE
jgi:NADH-quinone oxidoreductase subunit G